MGCQILKEGVQNYVGFWPKIIICILKRYYFIFDDDMNLLIFKNYNDIPEVCSFPYTGIPRLTQF